MQVSSDGTVKFVARSEFGSRDKQEKYYRLTVLDESGETLDFFVEYETYVKLGLCEFGQPLSICMTARKYKGNLNFRVNDVVLG